MHFSFHFTHLPSLSSSFARKIRETKLAWGRWVLHLHLIPCFIFSSSSSIPSTERWRRVEDRGLGKGRKPEFTECSASCSVVKSLGLLFSGGPVCGGRSYFFLIDKVQRLVQVAQLGLGWQGEERGAGSGGLEPRCLTAWKSLGCDSGT